MTRAKALPVLPTLLSALLLLTMVIWTADVGARGNNNRVQFVAPSDGQQITGKIRWEVTIEPGPAIERVEFAIDEQIVWSERDAPFVFQGDAGFLDPTSLSEGKHTLSVLYLDKQGRTEKDSIAVTVAKDSSPAPPPLPSPPPPSPPPPSPPPPAPPPPSPPPPAPSPTAPIITSAPSDPTTSEAATFAFESITPNVTFECSLDGRAFAACSSPRTYTSLTASTHRFAVKALSNLGSSAPTRFNWTVRANPPYAVTQSVTGGATLSNTVVWTASPSDVTATAKVDFYVDDVLRNTDTAAPYGFAGDEGQLDTTTLPNGSHTLTAKATAVDGTTANATAPVTVSNASTTTADERSADEPKVADARPSPELTAPVTTPGVTATTLTSRDDGDGLFVLRCGSSHLAQVDPIVSPGAPSGHLHEFFGNRSTSATSTYASMRAAGTTCPEQNDTAGYWEPALIGPDGQVIRADGSSAYYSSDASIAGRTQPYPADLRIVAGGVNAGPAVTFWACKGEGVKYLAPPKCTAGIPRAIVHFPQCWDGKNLDSPDHRSHVAYPRAGACPSTHPVKIPHLKLYVRFALTVGGAGYKFSDGTTLPHADFWNTWNQPALEALVRDCLNAGVDCGKQQ